MNTLDNAIRKGTVVYAAEDENHVFPGIVYSIDIYLDQDEDGGLYPEMSITEGGLREAGFPELASDGECLYGFVAVRLNALRRLEILTDRNRKDLLEKEAQEDRKHGNRYLRKLGLGSGIPRAVNLPYYAVVGDSIHIVDCDGSLHSGIVKDLYIQPDSPDNFYCMMILEEQQTDSSDVSRESKAKDTVFRVDQIKEMRKTREVI